MRSSSSGQLNSLSRTRPQPSAYPPAPPSSCSSSSLTVRPSDLYLREPPPHPTHGFSPCSPGLAKQNTHYSAHPVQPTLFPSSSSSFGHRPQAHHSSTSSSSSSTYSNRAPPTPTSPHSTIYSGTAPRPVYSGTASRAGYPPSSSSGAYRGGKDEQYGGAYGGSGRGGY
ncbi:hypothetical protein JCM8547_005659 [Rhodosporidiobolus lusitaniae]